MTNAKLPDEYLNIVLGGSSVNGTCNINFNNMNHHVVSGLEKLGETYIITKIQYPSTSQFNANKNGGQLHPKQEQQQQQQRHDQSVSDVPNGDQEQDQNQLAEGSEATGSATSTLSYLLKDKVTGEQYILNFMPYRTVGCLARCANTYYITSGLNPRKLNYTKEKTGLSDENGKNENFSVTLVDEAPRVQDGDVSTLSSAETTSTATARPIPQQQDSISSSMTQKKAEAQGQGPKRAYSYTLPTDLPCVWYPHSMILFKETTGVGLLYKLDESNCDVVNDANGDAPTCSNNKNNSNNNKSSIETPGPKADINFNGIPPTPKNIQYTPLPLSQLNYSVQKGDLYKIIELAINISKSVQTFHEYGVVCNSLCPDSIMVKPSTNSVKITNFEFAFTTLHESSIANYRAINKTSLAKLIPYTAPENFEPHVPVDFRADFYSIGAILYELLTGELPFKMEVSLKLTLLHMMQVPKPPHLCFVGKNKDLIPKELSDVVLKLLAINSYERYPSIDFVIHDLCLILNLIVERESKRELKEKEKANGEDNGYGDVKSQIMSCVDTFKELSSSTVRLLLF
ncbi:unnamed protein product [Ambrosiozyma monospora]|uniref:Unnamed protein product n=1 Tax=Ambrosiozyma monospora TaxID=43982 RepID=A0ACB5TJ09_AMBMO|nr:unnamed protein product [Ambrosiozyma monospora]